MRKLLSPEEVADILGTKISTVSVWARKGILPSVRVGRFLRFEELQVEAWIAERRTLARRTQKGSGDQRSGQRLSVAGSPAGDREATDGEHK